MGRKRTKKLRKKRKPRLTLNHARRLEACERLEHLKQEALEYDVILIAKANSAYGHWMFETRSGERLLNYWPATGRIYSPITGVKAIADTPEYALWDALDPPYSTEAGRDMALYAQDSGDVAHRVRAYCLERGSNPMMRLCLAGYAGEGHEELEAQGWEVVAWKAAGGYGNRSAKGKENRAKERLWFSPHCLKNELPLFGGV